MSAKGKSKTSPRAPPGAGSSLDEPTDRMDSTNGFNVSELKKKRQYMRQKITNAHRKFVLTNTVLQPDRISTECDKLRDLLSQVSDLNEQIVLSVPDEEIEQTVLEDETYETKLEATIEKLMSMLPAQVVAPQTSGQQVMHHNSNHSSLQLPKVNLPKFNNPKVQDLTKFFKEFESIINKHNISSYEKFIHLKDCLDSSPRILIEGLDTTQQNYEEAKQLLQKAFGSTVESQYNVIKKLQNLKMSNTSDPYSYIGELSGIMNSFKDLNITANVMMQCIVWENMCNRFQTHITNITNKNHPSMDDIMKNVFIAAERFMKQSTQIQQYKNKSATDSVYTGNKEHKSTSLAANVKKFKNACCLCVKDGVTDVTHNLRSCKKYESATSKVNKIKLIGGCTKCGNSSHLMKDCKFIFSSKCRSCNEDHMSFLCENAANNDVQTNRINTSANVSTSVCTYNVSWVRSDSVILPTASALVYDQDVRILKDSGSQENFVTEQIAKKHKGKYVQTSVDYRLQIDANAVVKKHYQQLQQNQIYNASVLVLDVKTRKVLAYI